MRSTRSRFACLSAILALLLGPWAASRAQIPGATIEQLLTDGWEVAGYVAAWENRTLILFKHKERRHLVQCSVLIDVMRNPRTVIVCYELK